MRPQLGRSFEHTKLWGTSHGKPEQEGATKPQRPIGSMVVSTLDAQTSGASGEMLNSTAESRRCLPYTVRRMLTLSRVVRMEQVDAHSCMCVCTCMNIHEHLHLVGTQEMLRVGHDQGHASREDCWGSQRKTTPVPNAHWRIYPQGLSDLPSGWP